MQIVQYGLQNALLQMQDITIDWLIATVSLISIPNYRQISSCIDCFSN